MTKGRKQLSDFHMMGFNWSILAPIVDDMRDRAYIRRFNRRLFDMKGLRALVGADGRFTMENVETDLDKGEALQECFEVITYLAKNGDAVVVNKAMDHLGLECIERDMVT